MSTEDLVTSILDEIALEGLEGIALEDLWQRLERRPTFDLLLDDASKRIIWEIVKKIYDVKIYKLLVERKPLVIFDRYKCVDPELGMVLEPDKIPEDIYPHHQVDDSANGVLGSCHTYETRVRICDEVKDLSYEEVTNRYGRKLVVVASQIARNFALKGPDADPMLELTILTYCVLERIGRSRYHGEVTQGKISLQVVGEDPKSLFYLRKYLTSHNLAVKQVHHQKSGTQNCSGSLLHLPRFYVERKPKALYLTEKVIEMLKLRENYIAEYDEVRQELGLSNALKKLFKTFDFQRYVKTDMRLPYRQLYPNAPITEWKLKGNDKEKMIRVIQLIDPNVNVQELWVKEEEEEEFDGDAERTLNCSHTLDRPLLSQAYFKIEEAGPRGYSQMELSSAMGISKLQSRTLCRNLLKCNLVATYMKDIGRQRVSRFMAKKFENKCVLNMQFNKEREKMLSLAKDTKNAIEKLKVPKKRKLKETFGGLMKRRKLAQDSPLKTIQENGKEAKKIVHQKESEKMQVEQSSEVSESEIADTPETIPPTLSTTKQLSSIPQIENSQEQKHHIVKESDSLNVEEQNETKVEFCEKLPQSSEIDSDSSLGASVSISSFSLESAVDGSEPSTSKSSVNKKRLVQKKDGIVTEIIDFSKSRMGQKSSRLTEELKNFFDHQGIENPSVTYRLLKRANIIIESIKKQEVIDDFSKLMKIINQEEDKEGYKVKIDKKSLMRLLFKLSNDGILKVIKVTLQGAGKEKILNFACEPSVTIDHSVIQSAIEQAKVKFFILNDIIKTPNGHQLDSDGQKVKSDDLATVSQSLDELQAISSKNVKHSFHYDKRVGKKYGFSPKFVRMKSLHQFLFYLIYGYQGDPNLDQAATIKTFEKKDIKLSEDEIGELSRIYVPEISWKMFVPKLPFHLGWPDGWSLMCDILLRLPLSVFVQLVNVSYIIPELDDLLKHPIRKHTLVKFLSPLLRGCLMASRRYIFSVHEVMQRLCFIGLLRFSPQRLKEKDQVFIFLNRQTSLLDTTTSKPGYHQISSDVVYEERKYVFQELIDVDKYWYEMWNICLHTNLGGRLCMDGKDIVLEMLHSKPAMLKSLEPVGANDAAALDTGGIPGDRKGAAGLDSAIFAHLKRNWNWPCTKGSNIGNLPSESLTSGSGKTKPQPKKHEAVFDNYKGNWKKTNISQPKASKKTTGANNSSGSTLVALPGRSSKSKTNITRRIKLRPSTRTLNKPYYDEADRKALLLMSKLRVEWNQKEDNLLLICKVASMFLSPNPHQQIVGFNTIRDLLHKKIPESHNKTSRACQRRILYMMKNVKTSVSVAMMLEEIRQDPQITKKFNISIPQLRKDVSSSEVENVISNKFIELVDVLEIRSEEIMKKPREFIPDSIEEFWEKYHVVQPTKSLKSKGRFQDVTNVTDILSSVVNSIIHSSLCVLTDKTSWSYQLFKVYQQFPDNLLRSTMTKIREDHMVSLKKPYMHLANKRGNYLPLSSSPYQHSISYLHILQTKYQYSVYNQAYKMGKFLDEIYRTTPEKVMKLLISDGGSTATLIELFCKNMVEFKIEIPEQIIILNPKVSELDESYVRIVERYREILQSYRSSKDLATTSMLFKSIDGDQDGNSDFESDDDKNDPDFNPDITSSNQQNALARTASRIALYMMREELEDKSVSSSQHAHDFFVVNSCAVYSSFVSDPCKLEYENAKSLLPLQKDVTDGCLKRISSAIIIPNKEINDENVHNDFLEVFKSEAEWPTLKKLLEDLIQRRELGMRQNQLKAYCKKYFNILTYSEVIQFLLKTKIVIRVGVTSVRYVFHTYIQPWLVWTYTLERLVREKIKPVNAKGLGPGNDILIEKESHKSRKRKRGGTVSYQSKRAKIEGNSVTTGDKESFSTPQSFKGKLKKFCSSSSKKALLKAKICKTLAKKRLEMIKKKMSASKPISQTTEEDVNKCIEQDTTKDGNVSTESEKCATKDSKEEKSDSASKPISETTEEDVNKCIEQDTTKDGNVSTESEKCATKDSKEEKADSASKPISETTEEDVNKCIEQDTTKDGNVSTESEKCATKDSKEEKADSTSKPISETTEEDVNKCIAQDTTKDGNVSTESEKCATKDSKEEKADSCVPGNVSQSPPSSILLEGNAYEEIKEMCTSTCESIETGNLSISVDRELETIESDKNSINIISNTKSDDSSNCKVNEGIKVQGMEEESKEESSHIKLNVCTTEQENSNKDTDQLCSEEKTKDLETLETKLENMDDDEVKNCEDANESGNSKSVAKTSCGDNIPIPDSSSVPCEQIISDKEEGGMLQSINDSSQQTNEDSHVEDFNKLNDSSEYPDDNKSICEEKEVDSNEVTTQMNVSEENKCTTILRKRRKPGVSRYQQLVEEKIAKAKELTAAAKLLEKSEAIHVCIRPWVRIDGTVNRRVLDRMLGAILGHTMYKPGNTIKDIAQRFSPALQPFHVRELIEILNEIGCVKLYVMHTFHNINLFTENVTTTLEPADGTEDDGDIVVEPQPDSIVRLGQFIGDKAYTKDFMSA